MNVLGIGNAIVDVICKVDESFLEKNSLTKSTMKLVDEVEFKKLLAHLKIEQTVAGGSVANSIVGMSQLGNKVGFIGKVCDDVLGAEYVSGLKREKVQYFYVRCNIITLPKKVQHFHVRCNIIMLPKNSQIFHVRCNIILLPKKIEYLYVRCNMITLLKKIQHFLVRCNIIMLPKKISIFPRPMQHNYVAEKSSIFLRSMQRNYVAEKIHYFHVRCNILNIIMLPKKISIFSRPIQHN